mmetsp:Transcript_21286/g.25609  ORF Transcript_21286/g.25609 Transcript_21286/m.25609 type:complete len:476 (-) Transcript_21286:826-2253(-)
MNRLSQECHLGIQLYLILRLQSLLQNRQKGQALFFPTAAPTPTPTTSPSLRSTTWQPSVSPSTASPSTAYPTTTAEDVKKDISIRKVDIIRTSRSCLIMVSIITGTILALFCAVGQERRLKDKAGSSISYIMWAFLILVVIDAGGNGLFICVRRVTKYYGFASVAFLLLLIHTGLSLYSFWYFFIPEEEDNQYTTANESCCRTAYDLRDTHYKEVLDLKAIRKSNILYSCIMYGTISISPWFIVLLPWKDTRATEVLYGFPNYNLFFNGVLLATISAGGQAILKILFLSTFELNDVYTYVTLGLNLMVSIISMYFFLHVYYVVHLHYLQARKQVSLDRGSSDNTDDDANYKTLGVEKKGGDVRYLDANDGKILSKKIVFGNGETKTEEKSISSRPFSISETSEDRLQSTPLPNVTRIHYEGSSPDSNSPFTTADISPTPSKKVHDLAHISPKAMTYLSFDGIDNHDIEDFKTNNY